MKLKTYPLILTIVLIGISCKSKRQAKGSTQKKVYYTHNFVSEISFEYQNRMISIPAQINSTGYRFILDSGAPTFISGTIVDANHLYASERSTAYDANGNEQEVNQYYLSNLNIGGKQFRNTTASGNSNTAQMPMLRDHDGLIGADLMKECIWMINYAEHKITLTDKIDSLKLPSHIYTTPMNRNAEGNPVITVILSDSRKMDFIVDVGYNGSFLVPSTLNRGKLYNDSLSYSRKEKVNTGFETTETQRKYDFIRTISSGDIRKENVRSSTTGKNTKALIGNEFLENYTVVLDFIHEKMILIPAPCNTGLCS